MLLEIRGRHLPGRSFAHSDGNATNVHVGVQVGRKPADLVPGDAEAATWQVEIALRRSADGLDFAGPAVQGRRGDRFVYLTWGDVDGDEFAMFRRAKLMLGAVDRELVEIADSPGRRLVATVELTDERGGPRCARLRPPAIAFSLG
ncbi:DUF5990 family protein [Luteipulveratus flavus]|uniref:DUF5990 family protein n=1 Tax=Luteipulveratus flavus TaxID=3031728 RepID=A0ABT6C3S3_9MICO|nr:DUF5990 family protein [Luteipulveratus sp. YIM 133296]MDF8263527.1 DUF5990 family protein [Luteipulveratus sp. YIM 133296]